MMFDALTDPAVIAASLAYVVETVDEDEIDWTRAATLRAAYDLALATRDELMLAAGNIALGVPLPLTVSPRAVRAHLRRVSRIAAGRATGRD